MSQGGESLLDSVSSIAYRKLHAPRENGGLLIDPPWGSAVAAVASQWERFSNLPTATATGSWHEAWPSVRRAARRQLRQLAFDYTSQYLTIGPTEAEEVDGTGPIVLSGHQPQLFHAGVWAKNFALDRLAREVSGLGIQIIIDNDLCRDVSIRVPTGSVRDPRVVLIPFDRPTSPLPYEARWQLDQELWDRFPERVTQELAPLLQNPLVNELWNHLALPPARDSPGPLSIGGRLSRARHRLEREWGGKTWEVPLSHICDTREFRWFLLWILSRGEFFAFRHNHYLQQYRHVHRIRSSAHPVPDLRRRQEWQEVPFWFWTDDDPQRRPLGMISQGREWILGDDSRSWSVRGPRDAVDCEETLSQLASLTSQGVRIRPRALTTTLFCRLFLGDLFIHGIGGAKYDQVTDLLIRDLSGFDPPDRLTFSWTQQLPIPHPPTTESDVRETEWKLRTMWFHPERFLDSTSCLKSQVSTSIFAKKSWLAAEFPRGSRRARHEGIEGANGELRNFLQGKRREMLEILENQRLLLRANRVLESREWSYCLFPSPFLRQKLLEIAPNPS